MSNTGINKQQKMYIIIHLRIRSKIFVNNALANSFRTHCKIISIALHTNFHCICYSLLENDVLFELFLTCCTLALNYTHFV